MSFYFYHLVPKGSNVSKGLLAPYALAKIDRNLTLKSLNKYRDRMVNGWNIYPNRTPESLSLSELLDGLDKFRGKGGTKAIYFFKFAPYKELGSYMTGYLDHHDIYRIDLDNKELHKYIESIYWGNVDSHTDKPKLTEEFYRSVSKDKYFSKYDESGRVPFAPIPHIGITFKNGICPRKFLTKIDIASENMGSVQESNNPFSTDMNIFISENDIYVNFDKFTKGKSNLLFVTGVSGSGKSTIAKKLAKKYRATYVELDVLQFMGHRRPFTQEDLHNRGADIVWEYINDRNLSTNFMVGHKNEIDYVAEQTRDFIRWVENRSGKYVIEGIQVAWLIPSEPKWYNYPCVFKGTSMMSSWMRRIVREFKSHESLDERIRILQTMFNTIPFYLKDRAGMNALRARMIHLDNFFETQESYMEPVHQKIIDKYLGVRPMHEGYSCFATRETPVNEFSIMDTVAKGVSKLTGSQKEDNKCDYPNGPESFKRAKIRYRKNISGKYTTLDSYTEMVYFKYPENLLKNIAKKYASPSSEFFVHSSNPFGNKHLGEFMVGGDDGFVYCPELNKWYWYDMEKKVPIDIKKPVSFSYIQSFAKKDVNEGFIPTMEAMLRDKKNLEYRFDQWVNGQISLLFITGFSGSGKTTLAEQLSRKYHCKLISVDTYGSEVKRRHPELNELPKVDRQRAVVNYIIEEFKDKRTIIEGAQIAHCDPELIKSYACIFMGTSFATSTARLWRRGFVDTERESYWAGTKNPVLLFLHALFKSGPKNTYANLKFHSAMSNMEDALSESTEVVSEAASKPKDYKVKGRLLFRKLDAATIKRHSRSCPALNDAKTGPGIKSLVIIKLGGFGRTYREYVGQIAGYVTCTSKGEVLSRWVSPKAKNFHIDAKLDAFVKKPVIENQSCFVTEGDPLMVHNPTKKLHRPVIKRHATDHKYAKYKQPVKIVSNEQTYLDWF